MFQSMPVYFSQCIFDVTFQKLFRVPLVNKALIAYFFISFLQYFSKVVNSNQLVTNKALIKRWMVFYLAQYRNLFHDSVKQPSFAFSQLFLSDQIDFFLFLFIVSTFAYVDHGVKLGYHDGTFSYCTKFASCQLVNKMTKGVIIFLFPFDLLNGQLQLALNFAHEKIVDHDIVRWVIQFVSYLHDPKPVVHERSAIQQVHGLEHTDESTLVALQLWPHEIADPKNQQIDILVSFFSQDVLPCFEKMMNQHIRVA